MTPEFVKNRLPEDVTDNSERFVRFLEDYYRFLSRRSFTGVTNELKELIYQQKHNKQYETNVVKNWGLDVSFAENNKFQTEILYRMIDEYLESRGTKVSFELLFKTLFNETVDISFPRDQLLYTSNSTYQRVQVILVKAKDIIILDNALIQGIKSRKMSGIESTIPLYINGEKYYVLECSNTDGNFLFSEPMFLNENLNLLVEHIPLFHINVVDGGSGYSVGDIIRPNKNNFNGYFEVVSVESGKIEQIEIVNGGSGYSVGDTIKIEQDNLFSAIVEETTKTTGKVKKIKIICGGYKINSFEQNWIIKSENGSGLELKVKSNSIGKIKKINVYGLVSHKNDITFEIDSENGSGAILKSKLVPHYERAYYIGRKGFLGHNSILIDSWRKHSHSYSIRSNVPASKYSKIVEKYNNVSGYYFNKIYTATNEIKVKEIEINGELTRK